MSQSLTSGSLRNYYRDEGNDAANQDAANYRINNNNTTTSKSFDYNTKLIRRTPANNNTLNTEVVL